MFFKKDRLEKWTGIENLNTFIDNKIIQNYADIDLFQ